MFKLNINRFILALLCFFTWSVQSTQAQEVVVYSARIEQLIKPMFDAFTKETGIKVKYTTDKEGKNTPADMLVTSDAGNLWAAAQAELLKPIKSSVLAHNIPAHLRDPKNQWFGLSIRARTLVYNTKKNQTRRTFIL